MLGVKVAENPLSPFCRVRPADVVYYTIYFSLFVVSLLCLDVCHYATSVLGLSVAFAYLSLWSVVASLKAQQRILLLERRARSWCKNNAKVLRRRRVKDHCWCPAIDWRRASSPSDAANIAAAMGPKILRSDFAILLEILGPSVYYVEKLLRVSASHMTIGRSDAYAWDVPWKWLGAIDVQKIMEGSAAVNMTTIGNTEALKSYKRSVEGALKLENSFSPRDQLIIEKEAAVPIIFSGGSPLVSDHAPLAALRILIRQQHARLAAVKSTFVPTLVVGSAAREANLYADCEHVNHYFHAAETKDYSRTIVSMLTSVSKKLRSMTNKNKAHSANKAVTPKIKIFSSLAEIAAALARFEGWGDRFFSSLESLPRQYERLVLEDVYELGPKDWRSLFLKTNANGAVGYGFYPDELMFPDCAPSKLYSYRYDSLTGKASVAYRFGVSNGYMHDHAKWACFLKTPVMEFPEFKLVFEITSRIGPFLTYTVTRMPCSVSDPVVRRFELRESRQFVRVTDFRSSVNALGLLSKKHTFAVLLDEWTSALNFALSLDEKSLTFQNILSQVRRIAGGVSLVNKELTASWELPKTRYADFALAVLIEARKIADHADWIEDISDDVVYSSWSILKNTACAPFSAFSIVVSAALRSNLKHHAVEYPANYVEHFEYMPRVSLAAMAQPSYRMTVSPDGERGSVYCSVCADMDGKMGDQLVRCSNGDKSGSVDIVFSEDDWNVVMTDLRNDDNDAPGLARVKKRVIDKVPKRDACTTVKMNYVEGGPGAGKSYLIRVLAKDAGSCVYLPFSKLMADYAEFVDSHTGETRKLPTATVHRGLELPVCDTLFVDEFTALDWRYIKMAILNTGATEVFLVGDVRQTTIREPEEGLFVGNHLNIANLPTHTLLKNFRNPSAVVAIINDVYDCGMMPASEVDDKPIVLPISQLRSVLPPTSNATRLTFTHATAEAQLGVTQELADQKYTVRSAQGSTADDVVLYVTEQDAALVDVHGMSLVALTRHKKRLFIAHDASAVAINWLTKHHLESDEAWETFMELYRHPSHTKVSLANPHVETLEDESVREFYQTVEVVEPKPVVRVEWLVLSRPQLVVGFCVLWRLFGVGESVLSNLSVVVLSAMMLSISFRDSMRIPILTPVTLMYSLFKWFLTNVYLTGTAIFLAFRAPGSVVSTVVETKSAHVVGEAPLISLLMRLYLPSWLRSSAVEYFVSLPLEWPRSFASYLHSLETVPGFAWARSPATVINHFVELPGLPSKLLRSLYLPLPFVVLCLACLWRCKNSSPAFVVYTVGPTGPVLGARNFLAALHVPTSRMAFQISSFDVVVPEGRLEAVLAVVDFSVEYVQTAGRYMTKSLFRNFRFVKDRSLDPADRAEKGRYVTPRDAYLGATEGLCASAFEDASIAHNTYGSSLIPGSWKSGKLDVEKTVNPFTKRGHPVKLGARGYAFVRGIGHTFLVKSMTQLVNVCGSRYLNPKARAPKAFDAGAVGLAAAMVNEFFREHMEHSVMPFSEDVLTTVELEADAAAKVKGYDKQLKGIDSTDYRLVRMHLKDIFKPSPKKTFDETKPGQGISAWSKDAQVTFGTCIRYFNSIFQAGLRSHVIFDNRLTTKQVMDRLNAAMDKVPEGAKNGVTDFTMFDAQQDEFTQEIEKQVLYRLGASESFVHHYYSNRKNYRILAGPLSGRAGTEKTSGEPGTLLFNSIVNVVIMNFLLRGAGPVAMAVKGDDGFKRQVGLQLDEERKDRVAAYTRLTMKLSFEDPAEFCGCVLGKGVMAPNLYRRLVSLQGKVFKDYKAFSLYQVSLRDWLSYIVDNGPAHLNEILAINTATFATSPAAPEETFPAVQAVLDQLVSLSHIGEEQFVSSTRAVSDVAVHQTSDGLCVSGVVPDPFHHAVEELTDRSLSRRIRSLISDGAGLKDRLVSLRGGLTTGHQSDVAALNPINSLEDQIRANDALISDMLREASRRKMYFQHDPVVRPSVHTPLPGSSLLGAGLMTTILDDREESAVSLV